MVVYVESNFVLELAFRQEQAGSCREILEVCRGGRARLVLPAFCAAEPFQAFVGRSKERKRAANDLTIQLGQLARSETFGEEAAEALQRVTGLLVRSTEEERAGLQSALQDLLDVAVVIPMDLGIIRNAAELEGSFRLSPQDAIVLASVLEHLTDARPGKSCFLNRNAKDFDDPDVVAALDRRGCKLIPRFDHGLSYVQGVVGPPARGI